MSAAPVEEFVVGDLDPAGVLELARVNEREIRERELLRLELAYQRAVLHPATADTGVETPGGPALDVLEIDESLGGDGTPAVAAFTPESFAAALEMSPSSAARLIGDALDLRHRLPLLWKRIVALEVPAWQARRVAQQTHRLPAAGARWVDEQLDTRAGCGPVSIDCTRTAGEVKVFVHVEAEELDVDAAGGTAFATGQVEKLGAATLAKIRHWVGHHQVVIQPVLNMQRGDPVDVHDPPGWMRELVILRDRHCAFPGCTRDARSCDLDHITPYQDTDDGPPGQTHPDNLACAGDTTAPKPLGSGATRARPRAATCGTDPTARRTSSPPTALTRCADAACPLIGFSDDPPAPSSTRSGPATESDTRSAGSVRPESSPRVHLGAARGP